MTVLTSIQRLIGSSTGVNSMTKKFTQIDMSEDSKLLIRSS